MADGSSADLGAAITDSAAQQPSILTAQAVSKAYRARSSRLFVPSRSVTVLQPTDLTVAPDQTLAVIGSSGSGKTTLTRILLGLTPPSGGDVLFRGHSLSEPATRRELRAASGVIFQNPASSFDPRWSIERSIAEPLAIQHPELSAEQRRAAVWDCLRAFDLDPALYADRYPVELSGGQIQRAAFARAVVNQPAVLLADEPMSAIDMPTRLMVMGLLARLRQLAADQGRQMATIIVSHDLGVVAHIADRVLVVDQGQVVESGPTAAVLAHPTHPATLRLIEAASV